MEDDDLENNTRRDRRSSDIDRDGEAGDLRQPRPSREVRELLQATNAAPDSSPDTPMVTRSTTSAGEAGDFRQPRVTTRSQSNPFRPIIFE